ncbi:zinc finger HIT domain-containing protein 2 [Anguilla anguilla]|uniref:zinc finger HIT domain-containing protein 2 n=1 Tax=Anguilla anguilla TaxID=7936 RepID=UPI0015B2E220|nr:zinc finger HIT domain-containing protein 2 [Anguilla anguilla]
MNPILRQKIPACVRTLLTDIRPRDEQHCHNEENDDIETLSVDGIKLPGRGDADSGELLTPAGMREKSKESDMGLRKGSVCGLCLSKRPSYTCPRCNVPYCDLACYRSSAHSICSEEFYKESVIQELRGMGETEEEGKRRMQEILVRLSKEGERKGGTTEVFQQKEEEGEEDGALENGEILVLLSRLAEIQSSGEGDTREIQDILTKLKEIGGTEEERGQIDETVASHRDNEELEEEEEQDLAQRFSGLDIESLSEEQLWGLLPQQDKERFEGLVKGGAIGGLVPLWSPWWERHEGGEGALVELLEGDSEEGEGLSRSGEVVKTEGKEKGKKGVSRERDKKRVREVEEEVGHAHGKGEKGKLGGNGNESIVVHGNEEDGSTAGEGKGTGPCEKDTLQTQQGHQKRTNSPRTGSKRKSPSCLVPQVNKKIPPLNTLSPQVSPLVRYSLVNVLYGYAASLSLFNGDLSEPDLIQEFCQVVLIMSESLSSNRVFSSLQEAIEMSTRSAMESGCFTPGDLGAQARAVEAVAHILSGKSKQDTVGYTLAALSQLQAVLSQARVALPKEGEGRELRRKYFLAGKKCEFLQSWVKDNGPAVRLLAGHVWTEHMKMEKERKCLDEEKKVVEESWKKGRGRGEGKLIEEMD